MRTTGKESRDAKQIEKFARELSARIARLEMTRPQVANLLNMRASTIQSYCGGHSRPNARNMQKLTQLLGEDLAEFFEEEELVGPTTPPYQAMPLTADFARLIVRIEVVTGLDVAQRLRKVLVDAGLLDSSERGDARAFNGK